jgi:hypothetical protein
VWELIFIGSGCRAAAWRLWAARERSQTKPILGAGLDLARNLAWVERLDGSTGKRKERSGGLRSLYTHIGSARFGPTIQSVALSMRASAIRENAKRSQTVESSKSELEFVLRRQFGLRRARERSQTKPIWRSSDFTVQWRKG